MDDVPRLVPETCDLVHTGVGALSWLPSVGRWARIVSGLLRPGGRLYLREGHPMACVLDAEREDRMRVMEYPFFEADTPQRWDELRLHRKR